MKKKIISSETCTPCGECCRKFPYIEISTEDIDRLIKGTGLKQEEFTNIKDAEKNEFFLKFKENGDCVFFKEDNKNSFSCGVYNSRPQICANYPVTEKQYELCEIKRISVLETD